MDIIANPMLVATVVMVVLCLLKVEVFFSIVASVFVCIFLSGANVNDSFWLFINGMGGNNEIVSCRRSRWARCWCPASPGSSAIRCG